MQPLSEGRVLLTHTMMQVGDLIHAARCDCFVTLYMQRHTSLHSATTDDAGNDANSLRFAVSSTPQAVSVKNANPGTRPVLENFPLKEGESLRVSCTTPSRHIVYGFATSVPAA
jgi:hypothetical protein